MIAARLLSLSLAILALSCTTKAYATRQFIGGDTVLFKRGSIIRDILHTCNGTPEAPIVYGAYDEGEKPAFLGSVAIGNPDAWVQQRPRLWRYTATIPSEVCNLIFNGGGFRIQHVYQHRRGLQHAGRTTATAVRPLPAAPGLPRVGLDD